MSFDAAGRALTDPACLTRSDNERRSPGASAARGRSRAGPPDRELADRRSRQPCCSIASARVWCARSCLTTSSRPTTRSPTVPRRPISPVTAPSETEWFPWERRAVDTYFPPRPTRVLVGGSGGGSRGAPARGTRLRGDRVRSGAERWLTRMPRADAGAGPRHRLRRVVRAAADPAVAGRPGGVARGSAAVRRGHLRLGEHRPCAHRCRARRRAARDGARWWMDRFC